MARKHPRPAATQECFLVPFHQQCWECGKRLWVASSAVRTVTTLDGLCQLTLTIRRCQNPSCGWYHRSYRPEEEGDPALPPSPRSASMRSPPPAKPTSLPLQDVRIGHN